MKDYEVFRKWLDEILGVPSMAQKALEKEMRMMYTTTKPTRARGKKGKFLADDLSTAYTNEAWVGGKAPKKSKK